MIPIEDEIAPKRMHTWNQWTYTVESRIVIFRTASPHSQLTAKTRTKQGVAVQADRGYGIMFIIDCCCLSKALQGTTLLTTRQLESMKKNNNLFV
jgi:hypothetical protein